MAEKREICAGGGIFGLGEPKNRDRGADAEFGGLRVGRTGRARGF